MIIRLVHNASITVTEFQANLEKIILGTMTTTTSGGVTVPANLTNIVADQCEVVGTYPSGIYTKLADNTFKKIHSEGSEYGIGKLTFTYTSNILDYIRLEKLDNTDTVVGTWSNTQTNNKIDTTSEIITIAITDKTFYIEGTTQGLATTGNGFYDCITDFSPAFVSTIYTDMLHMVASFDDDIEVTWQCPYYPGELTTGQPEGQYNEVNMNLVEIRNDYIENAGKKYIIQTPIQIHENSNYLKRQYFGLLGVKNISQEPAILGGRVIYNSDLSKHSLVTTSTSSNLDFRIAIEG